ncbi:MAG: hypothetical protein AB8G77_15060 [Rhodothermales bacterium]
MEIVPILSTIILVGTVATFILAVAAYILYKMREGSAQESELQMERDPHHVVMAVNQAEMMYGGDSAPAEASMYYAPTGTTPPGDRYFEANSAPGIQGQQPRINDELQSIGNDQFQGQSLDSFFWEYSDQGFAPINMNGGPERNQRGKQMSALDPDKDGE